MVGVEMGEAEGAGEDMGEEAAERMGLRWWPPPLRLSRRLMSRPLKWALIYSMGRSKWYIYTGCSLSKNFFGQIEI